MVFRLCLLIGYYVVFAGVIPLFLKHGLSLPSEWLRKMHHIAFTMSIFVYLNLFSVWYEAVIAIFILMVLFFVALSIVEPFSLYKKTFPERKAGDFKRQLIAAQFSLAALLFVFWGLLGPDWIYVAVVAAMVWGFGDAAAALVGKSIGRRKIHHRWVEGSKTLEGTMSMLVVAAFAIFFTILIYAGKPWYTGLTVALVVAPVSAGVELVSKNGSDTLTVPLTAAILTLALMTLLSV